MIFARSGRKHSQHSQEFSFHRKLFGICFGIGVLLWMTFACQPALSAAQMAQDVTRHQSTSQQLLSHRVILPQWQFDPGPLNTITDVPGVAVGHVTLFQNTPEQLRTGVTALIPGDGDLSTTGYWAAGTMLNGNGELTGLHFIQTSGVLNAPILLTNTFSVGNVFTGVLAYYMKHYPGKTVGSTRWETVLPVVAECYDGYFNTIEDLTAVKSQDAIRAIESAKPGIMTEGSVGAGTGMRSFELHAGIGSASRQITLGGKTYTIGVLVNANHSRFKVLSPVVKQLLEKRLGRSLEAFLSEDSLDRVHRAVATPRQGSIIVILATDLPLLPNQLSVLAQHVALGIGAMGSTMDTSSGDGVIAFSTAHPFDLSAFPQESVVSAAALQPDALTPVFRATVEAVTEAQINALLASHLQAAALKR